MSNRSLLGRSDGSATITPASLYHHSHRPLSGDSSASVCDNWAQGGELVWSAKHHPGVCLGDLRTFNDFLLRLGLRWDAAISRHIGPRRYCTSSFFSPGSGEMVLRCGSRPPHPGFLVFVRGLQSRAGGSEGSPRVVENKISGVEAESGKALHCLTWILYSSLWTCRRVGRFR